MRFFSLLLSLLSISLVSANVVTTFNAATALNKINSAASMLSSSIWNQTAPYSVSAPYIGPTLQWDLIQGAVGFAERKQEIQSVPFLIDQGVKSVHRNGVAGTVNFSVTSGVPPAGLFLSSSCTWENIISCGVVRFSSGTPTSMLGIAIAVFGDGVDATDDTQGNVQTRVFASDPAGPTQFNVNVTQVIGGITVNGPEGQLVFTPSTHIHHIHINDNKNDDFRVNFTQIPAGTVVGFISSTPEYKGTPFNVTITTTSALVASQAADQLWHFKRTLGHTTFVGGFLLGAIGVVGWIAPLFLGAIPAGSSFAVNTIADPTICPFASNPNLMNQATIAAIVVASMTTLIAIVSTTMLIQQRKQQQKQVTAIPL